jgi:septal ring factor EnvC (AmiA/AmiB activator)
MGFLKNWWKALLGILAGAIALVAFIGKSKRREEAKQIKKDIKEVEKKVAVIREEKKKVVTAKTETKKNISGSKKKSAKLKEELKTPKPKRKPTKKNVSRASNRLKNIKKK